MKLSKKEAAITQLCDAISLFKLGRFISSITLAAASEEVLAQLLKSQANKPGAPYITAEEIEAGMFDMFKDFLGVRNYHTYRNKTKNELKHHGAVINKDYISGNFKQIALNHISGALVNFKGVYNKLPDETIIQDFCTDVGIS